jgi:DNA-binding Lrp family transcriptional regulator
MRSVKFRGEILQEKKKIKLDLKDRKILFELSKNARYSLTSIGESVGLTKESVSYRLKSLVKNRVVYGYITEFDLAKLGYMNIKLCLKLKEFSDEDALLEKLKQLTAIRRIQTCLGHYDLTLMITTKTIPEYEDAFDKIMGIIGHKIYDYVVLTQIHEEYLGLNFLLDDSEHYSTKHLIRNKSSFETSFVGFETDASFRPDEKDLKIMHYLKTDARITIRKLAALLGLSVTAVYYRIKKLVENKYILNFFFTGSLSHLGYQWHKVFFRIKPKNDSIFIRYLREHNNVTWMNKYIGEWNYQISIFARNDIEFAEIIKNLRIKFSDILIAYEPFLVLNQIKSLPDFDY